METLKTIGILLLIVIVIFGAIYLDYWVFAMKHPSAPFWIWLLFE
jgi:hypothetical protein